MPARRRPIGDDEERGYGQAHDPHEGAQRCKACHCSADRDTDGKDSDEAREMGEMSSGMSSPTPEQAAGNAAQSDGRLDVTRGARKPLCLGSGCD